MCVPDTTPPAEGAGSGARTPSCSITGYHGGSRDVVAPAGDPAVERYMALQASRIEALETALLLARGVGHDIRALLTSALAALAPVLQLPDAQLAEHIRHAVQSCAAAARLARQFTAPAGASRGQPELLNPAQAIRHLLPSLEELWLERIDTHTALDDRVVVWMDHDQFTELVLNLLRNACEAMPDGGRLTVAVSAGQLPASGTDGPPTHAVLTVADSGCGIPSEVQKRLFEPFFTTKPEDAGLRRGLGLAVVYAAVRNAGGIIDVDSTPGQGATFRVWLPLAKRLSPKPAQRSSQAP